MGIADQLIINGWNDETGELVSVDGRVCLVGAAACADGMTLTYGRDYETYSAITLDGRLAAQIAAIDASLPLDPRRSDLEPVDRIWFWNDDPDRTFDEVLRVAKHADELLDAQ